MRAKLYAAMLLEEAAAKAAYSRYMRTGQHYIAWALAEVWAVRAARRYRACVTSPSQPEKRQQK
jgi:hypothetical protein